MSERGKRVTKTDDHGKRTEPDSPLRMRALCEATGLSRQTIHFYIKEGLLPPGEKTGRNTALYGPVHLARLRQIQRLQDEHFLPLKAIKSILDDQTAEATSYSSKQRAFLADVRASLQPEAASGDYVEIEHAAASTGVSEKDIHDAIAQGTLHTDASGNRIAGRDMWMVELFGEMRRAGFSEEDGFQVADVALYERAIHALVHAEVGLITSRLSHRPPAQVAQMIETALPVVHQFISLQHARQVQAFFSTLTATSSTDSAGADNTPALRETTNGKARS